MFAVDRICSPLARLAIAALVVSMSVPACSGQSSCWSESPTSKLIQVGESVRVTVEVVEGGYDTPDIAGGYWANYDGLPGGMPENGEVEGTATLIEAIFNGSGTLSSGLVRIDFDNIGQVDFIGPLGCS